MWRYSRILACGRLHPHRYDAYEVAYSREEFHTLISSRIENADVSEEVDVKSELKKYKEMLDEGLIDKEDYEAKKDALLGL